MTMSRLLLPGFLVLALTSLPQGDSCGKVVCYTTNWSQYRPGSGKFMPENIDPSLCTHAIYAFAKLIGNHLAPFEWNDDNTDWSVGLYERFNQLKNLNPALKTLIAVGGWNMGSEPFSRIVQSPSNRKEFITQSIEFLRQRNFDGLDLDWEYPANRGSPPQDRDHFTALVRELKEAYEAEAKRTGKPRLLLTAAVAAGKSTIDTAYDVPAIARDLDFINLMSYDLHGAWEKTTGFNSPLYPRKDEKGDDRTLNLDFAAKYWVQKGAPKEKLIIGMGLYGRSFTLASTTTGVGAPAAGAGNSGVYTREAGFNSYYEICNMKTKGGTVVYHQEHHAPYIYLGNQWVGYDDQTSLREKVRYVKQNAFGGAMVWALPLDDFKGDHCNQGPFPLLTAINQECGRSTGTLPTAAPPGTTGRTTVRPNTNTPASSGSCGKIVCYTTNWSQYRPGSGKFMPDDIDPSLCTHLIYAFAKLTGNHLAPFEWNDDSTDWSIGLYERFNQLKNLNPALKTLLAVGGWNMGSEPFTQIVQSPSNRKEFITQSIEFLRQRNFDGLDLDWEYPANRGSPPEDRNRFTALVKELKEAYEAEAKRTGKPRLLLTAAVAAGKSTIDTAYDVPAIARDLDFINLMSYDLHGSWEKTTGFNSPLYPRSDETGEDRNLNLDFAAKYWVQKGAPKEKLIIGMGLYGRSFTLATRTATGVGAPAVGAGTAGMFTREDGFNSFYEICNMKTKGGTVMYHEEHRAPYIYLGNQWVGFDHQISLREKVRYVKEHGFGGAMVWALPLDDFKGEHCSQGPYPLLTAINQECGHSTGTLPTAAPPETTGRTTVRPNTNTPPDTTTYRSTTPRAPVHGDSTNCKGLPDGFYPVSGSCRAYFVCVFGNTYSFECPVGLVFDPRMSSCNWSYVYECTIGDAPAEAATSGPAEASPSAPTRPPTSGPSGATTSAPNVLNDCKHLPEGIREDPTDCKFYIQCANGFGWRRPCPPGTVFNAAITSCDAPYNVPSCSSAG